jgi:PRP38 family
LERALFCSDRYSSSQNAHPLLRRLTQLLAESLIDKAIEVRFIGGVYSNQRPTEFLCLLLKLLQIQPEKEILVEYLRAEEFKYLFSFFIKDYIDSFLIDIYAHSLPYTFE